MLPCAGQVWRDVSRDRCRSIDPNGGLARMAKVRLAQLDWHASKRQSRPALVEAVARYEAAKGALERAVRMFRWVFTMNHTHKHPGVLPRAWQVHRALQRVRQAEAALRELEADPAQRPRG